MGHDEIADGVEDFDPVPVGLIHAGKQAGIFQRDRGMSRNGLQDLFVFIRARQSLCDAPETQHPTSSPEAPSSRTRM